MQSSEVWAWELVLWRTGKEKEEVGELPRCDSMEIDFPGEILDKS